MSQESLDEKLTALKEATVYALLQSHRQRVSRAEVHAAVQQRGPSEAFTFLKETASQRKSATRPVSFFQSVWNFITTRR